MESGKPKSHCGYCGHGCGPKSTPCFMANRAQDSRRALAFQPPQLTVPPPTATFSSSAVVLANPSYVQAPYVHAQVAGNPPGSSYLQPRAPLYRDQPAVAVSHPQAVSVLRYPDPSSLNMHSAAPTYPDQLVSQYLPQEPPRPYRAHPIAAPSFP
ncbi:hypothetical protein D5F01_LYC23758 [Larimichthys crocea]|uniref:Uncharacterized protein n=1 Tax=Larimichthys crocea TaxID=215358 RepID=A0A6G0HG08_LARCR|nr:hypothetical protein D5F01_LYC23756 [Larimichthys crocea]KAE8278170.1 hypothetical protein D5F01_LYC23758 [Larimichthys crocea]